jgi:amino-acid N-acetyltransferase
MTSHVLQQALVEGLENVYLLTETAEEFFLRIGFHVLDREYVPTRIRTSVEFASLCPTSAVAMVYDLSQDKGRR